VRARWVELVELVGLVGSSEGQGLWVVLHAFDSPSWLGLVTLGHASIVGWPNCTAVIFCIY
jgi:hypothetical protein